MTTVEEKKTLIERQMADWNADNFCIKTLTKDINNQWVPFNSAKAVKFCVVGKLCYNYTTLEDENFAVINEIINDFLNEYHSSLATVNDYDGQTAVKEKLLHLYD